MVKKVVVLGASGQLGSDIVKHYDRIGWEVFPLTHEKIEVADELSVASTLCTIKPDCVINTAAMHNVEACEADPGKSFSVNAVGSRNLAITCRDLNAHLIHFSTDYVFNGIKQAPYQETDLASPLNVYGNTKLSGESFILAENSSATIVRISGVYGTSPCRAKLGMNFIRLMIKLAKERDEIRVVDDEILTPTFTEDIARQCSVISEARISGVIHSTCQGECSWYVFAERILSHIGAEHKLKKARTGEFPSKVRRPMYSVLDNAVLKRASLDVMPDWQDSLAKYLSIIQA